MNLAQLAHTAAGSGLHHLAGPGDAREITALRLLEDLDDTPTAAAGLLLLVPARLAGALTGHRLDVLLRRLALDKVTAVLLVGVKEVPRTATVLAERGKVALVGTDPAVNLTDLLLALDRELRGGSDALLARAEAIVAATTESASVEDLCESTGRIIGAAVEVDDRDADGTPVWVDGRVFAKVRAAGATAVELRLIADGVSHAESAIRRQFLPALSSAELLVAAIEAQPGQDGALLDRIHQVGLPVDGWHCAVRLEPADAELGAADPVDVRDFHSDLVMTAQAELRQGAPGWRAGPYGNGLLLVHSRHSSPGANAQRDSLATADRILGALDKRFGLPMVCGVGGVRRGIAGLRTSTAEARSALAGAITSGTRHAVAFDAVGVRRMMQEWLSADSARQTVQELLAPVDRLGDKKADVLIETLHVFLEEEGSLVRSAERLRVHRNAVVGRIQRLREVLDSELTDPEERLMLRLACRARLLQMT